MLDKALTHGSVVIAAITSCTNTSNPSVLVAAGLLAKKAVEKGLTVPPWVKTSLAPGSMVVTEYLTRSGLMPYLEKLKFNLVGYGCTTCIGNSGPLPQEVSSVITDKDLVVASVLSGNRNFEGRINSEVRANYLMSPPLVVAFALAGRIDIDMYNEPLGYSGNGKRSRCSSRTSGRPRRKWTTSLRQYITGDLFQTTYSDVFKGDERWRGLNVPAGRDLRLGRQLNLRQESALLRQHAEDACAGEGHLRRARALLPRTTASPPTTSRPPAPSSPTARRDST